MTTDAAAAELCRQHARIAELQSELEAVGAGGVQALSAAPAIGDELRDTLVAVSAAIAEQDDRTAQKMIREILAASPAPPAEQQAALAAPAWADQAVIEYRYTGGTHWCPLGPAERMKPDFDGVYRLQGGVFPVEQAAPKAEPANPEYLLGNLLARIHGDGGHYTSEHGLTKAVEDAELLVSKWQRAASRIGRRLTKPF